MSHKDNKINEKCVNYIIYEIKKYILKTQKTDAMLPKEICKKKKK